MYARITSREFNARISPREVKSVFAEFKNLQESEQKEFLLLSNAVFYWNVQEARKKVEWTEISCKLDIPNLFLITHSWYV